MAETTKAELAYKRLLFEDWQMRVDTCGPV